MSVVEEARLSWHPSIKKWQLFYFIIRNTKQSSTGARKYYFKSVFGDKGCNRLSQVNSPGGPAALTSDTPNGSPRRILPTAEIASSPLSPHQIKCFSTQNRYKSLFCQTIITTQLRSTKVVRETQSIRLHELHGSSWIRRHRTRTTLRCDRFRLKIMSTRKKSEESSLENNNCRELDTRGIPTLWIYRSKETTSRGKSLKS